MNDIDMRELGKCCRDLRLAAKLSAEELAKRCGIDSGPTITRFETNQATAVTFTTIYKLLSYLGELDIIKERKFDFSGYNPETARIINAFSQGDKPNEYRNRKNEITNYIDQHLDKLDVTDLEAFMFFIKNRIAFRAASDIVTLFNNKIKEHGKDSGTIQYPDLICEMIKSNEDTIKDTVVCMLESMSPDTVSNFTNTMLGMLYPHLENHLKNTNNEEIPSQT